MELSNRYSTLQVHDEDEKKDNDNDLLPRPYRNESRMSDADSKAIQDLLVEDEILIAETNESTKRTTNGRNLSAKRRSSWHWKICIGIIIVICLSLILVIVPFVDISAHDQYEESWLPRFFPADRITFGSCSSFDLRDIPIWTKAVIEVDPTVWIWTGDMVYTDAAPMDCSLPRDTLVWQQNCNCTPTWLNIPPHSCRAGDLDYGLTRWIGMMQNGKPCFLKAFR